MSDIIIGNMRASETNIEYISGEAAEAEANADQLADLYERDFVDPPLQGTEFFSKERFLDKLLNEYIEAPNFKIVIAKALGGMVVGFIYGCTLPQGTQWWKDIKEPLPEGLADESGERTLAILDILVKRGFREQGIGTALHNKLIEGRSEQRATLLSSPPQQPAYSIFQRWEYEKIGTAEPEDDGTIMHTFVRQLK